MAARRPLTIAALFPRAFAQWLGPLLVAGVAAILIGVLVITSGRLDLGASTPHPEGWGNTLHYVFQRSVAHRSADLVVPPDLDAEHRVIKGAVYYERVCANCHGAPGLGQNPIALAMRPQPQNLMTQAKLFDARGLAYILDHGVKYSAMPAWPVRGRIDEIWSLVAFLRRLPTMSNAQFLALAEPGADPRPPAVVAGPTPPTYRPDIAMPSGAFGLPGEYALNRPAIAFGRGTVGADPAQACVQCHAASGAGRPGSSFPNLTILDAATFKKALTEYATGARVSAYMQPVAVQLSDTQIDTLTAAFAARPRVPSPQFAAAPVTLALGRRIAEQGVPATNVGACQNCHDINRANQRAYPAIAGQNAIYQRDQLHLYKAGVRGRETGNPMPAVARGLEAAQIAAVTAYYGALPAQRPEPVAEGAATARR